MSRKRDRLKRQARIKDHKEFKKWLTWFIEETLPDNSREIYKRQQKQRQFIEDHITILRTKYKTLTIPWSEGF